MARLTDVWPEEEGNPWTDRLSGAFDRPAESRRGVVILRQEPEEDAVTFQARKALALAGRHPDTLCICVVAEGGSGPKDRGLSPGSAEPIVL